MHSLSATPVECQCCFAGLDALAALNLHLMLHTTYTHLFNGPLSGTTWVSRYQKSNTIWILLKQETVSGSGISWAVCKSAPHSRQTTTPARHLSFLQAGCPYCHPTNSDKALKAVAGDELLLKMSSVVWQYSKVWWTTL